MPTTTLQTLRSGVQKHLMSAGDKERDLYQELPPFSVNPETGEVLNPSSSIKLVKVGTESIQDKIQSYYDSSSLAKQLEHIQEGSLDSSSLNSSNGSFFDVSQVPSDIDDLISYLSNLRDSSLKKKAELSALETQKKVEAEEKAKAEQSAQDEKMKAMVAAAVADAMAKKGN